MSITTSHRYFGLDFLRAIAVILVLIAHGASLVVPVFTPGLGVFLAGYWGVEIFFVLSGFLVGGLLIDGHEQGWSWVPKFWMRRWLRTLPNYYLFLGLNILFFVFIKHELPPWPKYLFFLQNLAWPHPFFFGEAWTLAMEEIFYLIAPLFAVAFATHLRDKPAALTAFAFGFLAFLILRAINAAYNNPIWDEGVRKVTLLRLDSIGWGVFTVYCFRQFSFIEKYRNVLACFGVGLIVLSGVLYFNMNLDKSIFARSGLFTLTSLAFSLLLPWAARWQGVVFGSIGRYIVAAIALISYSLYLTHLLVIRLILESHLKATNQTSVVLALCIFFVVTAVISTALYHFFEKPILQSRDALSRILFAKK